MPSSKKDKNGNEISQETEEEKQNRINRNMAKFLSMEKQQQQLVLCLRQQQMPKNLLQMGKRVMLKPLQVFKNVH